jgi:hypothetical protein
MRNNQMYENIFAGFAIDTNDPALADSFAPIPEAVYPVFVSAIEQGFDNAGGVRFTAKVQIREGHFNGRVVTDNFNLGSANPQAVEIGKKQLAALARACGVNGQLTNPQQVINIPIFAKIGPQKGNSQYSRVIAYLSPADGARMMQSGGHTVQPATGAPAFVPPAAPVAPTFAAPAAQPQPAAIPAQPAMQPQPMPAAQPQPAFVPPAQPAQPAAAATTHKMPWEQ